MKEELTDIQVAKIEAFCADTEMYNAVKTVLLQHIYSQGIIVNGKAANPLKNRAFSLVQLATENPIPNDQLGAHLRGVWEGVNALETGYAELNRIKSKPEVVEPEVNEAI